MKTTSDIVESQCSIRECVHYWGVKGDEMPGKPEHNQRHVCAAFPNGIPDVIAFGKNKHLVPYNGDHGIQYERESRDEKKAKGSR